MDDAFERELTRIRDGLLQNHANVLFYYDPKRNIVWREQSDWSASTMEVDYSAIVDAGSDGNVSFLCVNSIAPHTIANRIDNPKFDVHNVACKVGLASSLCEKQGSIMADVYGVTVQCDYGSADIIALVIALEGAFARAKRLGAPLCMFWVMTNFTDGNREVKTMHMNLSLTELFARHGVEVCQLSPDVEVPPEAREKQEEVKVAFVLQ